ncbi:tRNA (adenosine(37)-N6)-threonylcarbamoyltransferase complex ATPase subunit type 1 TsaE [Sphingomonas sp. ID0503]|uniref:tRNA (adenosine(37)-N6)-threonylcarbamoyltransferase complex ATPase subunit type 1 TsaE n=1 Tax=Sphingomonas sp. ID0503 TaxID=3399691 RepID=UPI003AFAC642
MSVVTLTGEAAMLTFGRAIAEHLRAGDVIALEGDLGAGKTSLARGILAGLGVTGDMPSPSFAIVQAYDPPEARLPVLHVDLYRLDDDADVRELGLDEALDEGAIILEWPQRLGLALWKHSLRLRIEGAGTPARRLTAEVSPSWKDRWPPQ